MTSAEIRQSFIDFFVERGHRLHPSAPLVPHGDPTLLFTNAGMVQFKDFFLGLDEPPSRRAVTSQKCLRVSGKHNDLENVGPSPRHHTFFEMLGNFSFGDYFKEEAIRFGWELVTDVWGLDPAILFATVFEEDDEAAALWAKLTPLPAGRIVRCGAKDNFWAMGETGPCGPCSEIFVDLEPDRPGVGWEVGCDSGRYLEIWNLVFMQFDRDAAGETRPLPNPSIDTGAGLERVAAVLQGVSSNYGTDLFQPILRAAAALAQTSYGRDAGSDVSLRVIADHLRAVAFLLADGVIPGNEGRGYVLRRLLRRAVRHGMGLGFEEPFLHRLLPVLGEVLGGAYPELGSTEEASSATIAAEEEKFLVTVATASRQVQVTVDAARREGRRRLTGAEVFRFYDTHGLPIDVVREIAEEERLELDEEGFRRELEAQRKRSREAAGGSGRRMTAIRELQKSADDSGPTEFVGYRRLAVEEVRVLLVARETDDGAERVGSLAAGEAGVVVLDRTPFYAESGGQVGDRGHLVGNGLEARVVDTQKDAAGVWFHFVRLEEGTLSLGDVVTARVDPIRRRPTERNHTATHLLQAALRRVLGDGVRQAGSLVAPDRLRFDFTYSKPVEPDELDRIETLVNRWVLEATDTTILEGRPFQEAVDEGAMALFGEKYGDEVRTVQVAPASLQVGGERQEMRSLELCGGCHVRNIGQIGPFVITSERGIASGVRRIEALTGEGAQAWLADRRRLLSKVEHEVGAPAETAADEIAALKARSRDLEKELSKLRLRLVSGGSAADEEEAAVEVDGVRLVVREVPPAPANELRNMADVLRSKLGSGVVVLAVREDGKVSLVAAVTADLEGRVHAGRLVQAVAGRVGGRGGGRSDFAQAGGREPEKLDGALAEIPEILRGQLG